MGEREAGSPTDNKQSMWQSSDVLYVHSQALSNKLGRPDGLTAALLCVMFELDGPGLLVSKTVGCVLVDRWPVPDRDSSRMAVGPCSLPLLFPLRQSCWSMKLTVTPRSVGVNAWSITSTPCSYSWRGAILVEDYTSEVDLRFWWLFFTSVLSLSETFSSPWVDEPTAYN